MNSWQEFCKNYSIPLPSKEGYNLGQARMNRDKAAQIQRDLSGSISEDYSEKLDDLVGQWNEILDNARENNLTIQDVARKHKLSSPYSKKVFKAEEAEAEIEKVQKAMNDRHYPSDIYRTLRKWHWKWRQVRDRLSMEFGNKHVSRR